MMASPKGNIEGFSIKIINFMKYTNYIKLCHFACFLISINIYIYIYIYRKVRLMKPTHDSLLLRVSCLRTHQTVFNKENSYHLVYIQACEKLLLFA